LADRGVVKPTRGGKVQCVARFAGTGPAQAQARYAGGQK